MAARKERPIFHGEIGRFIASLREQRKWSQREAVSRAARRGLALGLGALRGLELGMTQFPDAGLLRQVGALYGVSYESLAQKFIEANYGVHVDVISRRGGEHPGLPPGGPHDPAAARVLELETELRHHEKAAGQVRDVAEQLFAIAVALNKDHAPVARKSGRRRAHRKAG